MTQTMLGNSDFQAKLDKVKGEGISEISETPSQFMPLDEGWAARRSNLDVVSTSQSPSMPYKLILHLCHMSKMMRRDSNDVDLCKWFVETADQQGWPKIDKARVDKASTTEFREGLTHPTVPIDGVKTLGSTVLHEVRNFHEYLVQMNKLSQFTHTNQGGLLLDTNVKDIKG
ncbi:hypothetical protein BN1723_000269, partial [Verticillium longisporum]